MNFPIQHQLQHIILVDVFHSRSCSAPFSLFCFEHKWTFPSSAAAVAVGIALLLHPAHSSHSIRSPPIEIWRSIFNIMRWLLAFMLSTYMEYLMILYTFRYYVTVTTPSPRPHQHYHHQPATFLPRFELKVMHDFDLWFNKNNFFAFFFVFFFIEIIWFISYPPNIHANTQSIV